MENETAGTGSGVTRHNTNACALIFLGPPGAGKGTQSERVSKALCIPKISSGDILRQNIRQRTDLGSQAKELVERGTLIPDALMCEVILERIVKPDCLNGFVLDGFPRTRNQAEILDIRLMALCRQQGVRQIQSVVIQLVVNRLALLRRLADRRVCPTCGSVYNIHTQPPRTPGLCDLDGSALEVRDDDSEETIFNRLTTYEQETLGVAEHYSSYGRVLQVDGDRPADFVTAEVLCLLGQLVEY